MVTPNQVCTILFKPLMADETADLVTLLSDVKALESGAFKTVDVDEFMWLIMTVSLASSFRYLSSHRRRLSPFESSVSHNPSFCVEPSALHLRDSDEDRQDPDLGHNHRY